MYGVGLMMLFGRKGRYAALLCGLSFSVLLVTQQMAIFLGVLERSTDQLQNVGGVDLWVTTRETRHISMTRQMSGSLQSRIQSVPGVNSASPFVSRYATAEMEDGRFHAVDLIGIDRTTLTGRPPEIVEGSLSGLRRLNTVALGVSRRDRLPGVGVGDVLRINDRRLTVVATCRSKIGIFGRPVLYTNCETAQRLVPGSRKTIEWYLVKANPEADLRAVAREIENRLQLSAFTRDQLRWASMQYITLKTSIGLNFVITAALGLLVGLVASAAAFSQFLVDNLPYFAVLKAVGTRSKTLLTVLLLQGLVAGGVSYGIGVGLAALMTLPGRLPDAPLTPIFVWQILLLGLAPVVTCVVLGIAPCMWRVLQLDPVMVFE